ncbi:hypothetical protein L3073_10540 [Ancylomarina sp. DW003]|nr:hypothetical protein [Ancylomarina sp. DW003]MDE5422644.1 hypothetical protein [Ancylomarina sp. DW003]
MKYSRRTIISNTVIPDDILNKKCLKIVILTQDEDIVKLADTAAKQTPFGIERIVVWVKDFDSVQINDQISGLQNNLNNCIAFSLSTINKVGLVMNDAPNINLFRVNNAFTQAGRSKNN